MAARARALGVTAALWADNTGPSDNALRAALGRYGIRVGPAATALPVVPLTDVHPGQQ